jgi:hypothetical protein
MARYIPILRLMRGERVGLQHLSPAGRTNVAPMLVIAPKQFVGKKATKKHPAIPAANVIANEIMTAWGTAPFYLDASALSATPSGHHPIVDIANACRAIGLNLIPATPLHVAAPYQHGVQAVVTADNRGVALRVDLNEFSTAAQWMSHWPFQLGATDLVVDVEDNAPMVATLGAAVTNVFLALPSAGQWRSVTIAGTSMPENFTGFVAGKHLIPRAEVVVWQRLNSAQLPYQIDFGDYATVSTAPAPSGIAWGFPINVRYTLAGDFLVCRGVATTGFGGIDMAPQLTGHAAMIVQHGGRGPLAHCWADGTIDVIAANGTGPQGLEHWVQLGVNRHIELVRNLLP